jgi:protease IV
MKFNPTLSQLFREHWFMYEQEALRYAPLLLNFITGSSEIEFEQVKPVIMAVDKTGSKYSIYDEAPKGSVAIIGLSGAMVKADGLCQLGTRTLAAQLTEAYSHPNISGAIILTDSGGGAVTSIPVLVDAIKASPKPIVAYVDDMAASAAYYAVSHASEIIASNDLASMVGSIGVMISFADVQPYYEKQGVVFHKIYAPESSDKNKAFDLAMKGDYDLIQREMLSPLAQKFQSVVRENRKGKLDESVPGLLSGKVFYANEAIQAGLIDSVGSLDFAVNRVLKLAAQNEILNFNF